MKEYYSDINARGQITIPREVRALLNVKPKDKVAILVEGTDIRLEAIGSRLDAVYQSVPALDPPRSLEEMMEIAREEHVHEVAHEGL